MHEEASLDVTAYTVGLFGYLLSLTKPETSHLKAIIWGSGFGLMEGRGMSLHKVCSIGQTLQRKCVNGPDSGGWGERFRAPCAHYSLPVSVQSNPYNARPAGEMVLFLLNIL